MAGIEIKLNSSQARKLDAIAEAVRDLRSDIATLTRVIGDAAVLVSQRSGKKSKARDTGLESESPASTCATS